jgi:hypothetical protein
VTEKHAQAGYSGTPLPRKLGFKPGFRAGLVNAPAGIEALLEPLPEEVAWVKPSAGDLDLIVFFTDARGELEGRFDRLADALVANGMLWIAWPKKASGVMTDLTESVVREVGLAHGLVDTKVCAISQTWSGLRFVRRVRDR